MTFFKRRLAPVGVAMLGAACAAAAEPVFPNAGFESGSLDNWTVEGDAFTKQPTKGDNPATRGRESSLHNGAYWIGGFEACTSTTGRPGAIFTDEATGTLTSAEFTVRHKYLSFLVGGGRHPGKAGVRLVSGKEAIELATGDNTESMRRMNINVAALLGQKARLVVYDNAVGEWGHINVDDFVASDTPVRDETADFALLSGVPADAYQGIAYDEPRRPQFHFSSARNWLNDPNGMVYDGEKYHLFFQHNPLAPVWGNMTWGHATSPDMVHWSQHGHSLLPYRVDGRSGTIFSGSAVVDHNNSLGVQQGDVKTLCAFFTFASDPGFYQAMAYSTDRGETWTYWNEGRPVIPNQGFDAGERDPKVFWHEASKRWVIALWVQQNPGRVRFFVSDNLTDWKKASDLMRDWAFECMDVVFLPIDGDRDNTKAVVYDASFDYEVGEFDGREFHTEAGPFVAGTGSFYAAQTFNNAPDNRVVQIGWMRGPDWPTSYGLPSNQQMAFPCELSLRTVNGEPKLFIWPVKEIEGLVESESSRSDVEVSGSDPYVGDGPVDLADIELTLEPGDAEEIVIEAGAATYRYSVGRQELRLTGAGDGGAPVDVLVMDRLAPQDGVLQLRMLVDRLSAETFAFEGERYHAAYIPPGDPRPIVVRSVGGRAVVRSLVVRRLESAWKTAPRR